MRAVVWLVVLGLIVAVAVFLFRPGPAPNPRDANGGCLLVGEARIVEAMGDLVVQPVGHEEWTDVTLTLRGQGIGAVNAGQPIGPFTLQRPAVKGRTALKLETFQKPSGERWVQMVMRPTDVDIEGTAHGEHCRLTKSF
jgi:hypothetical protein